jgi:sporulation protein YlmC with PRC-barrel domain
MKRLFLLLSLTLILALVVAGCTSTEEQTGTTPGDTGVQEATPAAGAVETPMVDDTQPGAMATQESGTVLEEPAAEAPAATEEPMVEAPAVTEEPVVEAPAATEEPLAEAPADETEVIPPTGPVNLNHMSNLLDLEVWNRNNEQIGEVNAIVIDKDASRIEYVIVGTGGFLGLGEKEIPVPWQVLEVEGSPAVEAESSAPSDQTAPATEPESNIEGDDTTQATEPETSVQADETQITEIPNVFILDLSQEELEQMPQFDLTPLYEPQTVEATSLDALKQEIQSFWQNDLNQSSTETTDEVAEADQTAGQMSGTENFVLADDLLGASVRGEFADMIDENPQQSTTDDTTGDAAQQDLTTQADTTQNLGTVEEILVNGDTGEVNYLLVWLTEPNAGIQDAPTGDVQDPALGAQESPAEVEPVSIQAVPVPLDAVEWNAEEAVLIYTGSESLEQAPTVNLDEIESDQIISSDRMSEADSFWGLEDSPSETQ